MKKNNKILIGAALISIAAFASCSEVPQEQIDAANRSVEEARTAGAEMYAIESFSALQDSLKAAHEIIEAQNSKFMFKNYDESTEKLQQVVLLANEVKQQTETKKETLKSEISTTLIEIKGLLEENRKLIAEAPRGKEGNTALVAIKNELTTIEQAISESDSLLADGQLMPSLDKAKAAKEKATAINVELKDVIAKFKGISSRKTS